MSVELNNMVSILTDICGLVKLKHEALYISLLGIPNSKTVGKESK